MNQNLCQRRSTHFEVLAEEAERRKHEWLFARQLAIDGWIKFLMPKLYEQNRAITEEMARLFAEMCLKEDE